MKALSLIAAATIWASALVTSLPAQPILNRVEQFIRDQVGTGQSPAPPATASEPGYLGIMADDRQDQGQGVRIVSVTPGGPASQGGLLNGDLITAIDGQPIRVMDDMARALDGKAVGTPVAITVDRVGVQRRQHVTLGRRPASRVVAAPTAELPAPTIPGRGVVVPQRPRLGVRTLPVTEDVRQQNGLPVAKGATVISVTVGSPAEQAGIPLGAVITAVDNRAVDTPQALAAAIAQAGSQVQISYIERGLQMQKQVVLDPQVAAGDSKLEMRGRPLAPPAVPVPSDGPTLADPATADATRIAELEARVAELEARLEKLEAARTPESKNDPEPNP